MALVFASIVSLSVLGGCDSYPLAGGRTALSPEAEAAGKLHQCASCHGDNGVSKAEIFPNLAGQQKDYIVAQLTAFRDRTRQDRNAKTYMWGMATGLSDATINALAEDYSAKSPAIGATREKAEVAAGKAIFETGVADHGVLACVSCHGAHGEGNAAIPSLAGQHNDYLMVQLAAFASGSRENAVMLLVAKAMTKREIEDVAAYISSTSLEETP
jgi:cytochrome c553